MKVFQRFRRALQGWPDRTINYALIGIGIGLVVLALVPGHAIFKAVVLAWVVLP